ncbi:hypothetical protein DIPPA_14947 [Diplonema papillatum]|nr:hypothetical protein DIPPA_14947 [Diplonema papillatum]
MDLTTEQPKATDEPKGSEALIAFRTLLHALWASMDTGTVADWMLEYTTEGVQFIIAPSHPKPELDARAYGREDVLVMYNAMLSVRFPGDYVWDFREEIQQLSASQFQVDLFSNEPTGVRKERSYFSISSGRVLLQQYCPQDVEEESLILRQTAESVHAALGDRAYAGKPPCYHNSWDSIRGRQSCTVLRCRDCSIIWKITSSHLRDWRCTDFLRECKSPRGFCRRIHIHSRKVPPSSSSSSLLPAGESTP